MTVLIKGLLSKLKALKFNLFIPADIKKFCETNRSRWQEFLGKQNLGDHSILVDSLADHPALLIRMAAVSNSLKKTKSLRTVWLTRSYFNRKLRGVIKSCGADRVENIPVATYPVVVLWSLVEAGFIYSGLKLQDLLELSYKGDSIGKQVYDSYLREKGYGTIF